MVNSRFLRMWAVAGLAMFSSASVWAESYQAFLPKYVQSLCGSVSVSIGPEACVNGAGDLLKSKNYPAGNPYDLSAAIQLLHLARTICGKATDHADQISGSEMHQCFSAARNLINQHVGSRQAAPMNERLKWYDGTFSPALQLKEAEAAISQADYLIKVSKAFDLATGSPSARTPQ